MSSDIPSTPHDSLLRDLLSGLSLTGPEPTRSVGLLASPHHAPQPPAHCLQACLDGDPNAIGRLGCQLLAAAAAGNLDPQTPMPTRCPKGFQVAARHTLIGNSPMVVFTVQGKNAAGSESVDFDRPEMDPARLLAHLDAASNLVQRIGQLLEENAGFANEVLQNYEQLNLIFDLTQQITQFTHVAGIERLLAQRVARLLSAETVYVVSLDGRCRVYPARKTEGAGAQPVKPASAIGQFGDAPAEDLARAGSGAALSDEMRSAVESVRRTRRVLVAMPDGRHLIAGPLMRLDEKVDVVLAVRHPDRGVFNAGDMMLLESVLSFGGQIISNTELHERMRRMSLEVTRALVAAIDKKDHYTSGHSERAGFLTALTAVHLGVRPPQLQAMEWAGLLHDVGKIGIPEEILCKPGKLTPEEFELIKQHPRMGYEILQPIKSLGVILDGVLYHHEYPDGSGYPEGLVGEQIPLVARIIHVVDSFDALTTSRSYREAFSIEEAIQIIRREEGTHIDAEVAEAFIEAFDVYRRDHPHDFALRFAHLVEREMADAHV